MKKFLAVLLLGLGLTACAGSAGPQAGAPAPEFKLQDQNGQWHTVADHHNRWMVLYFYPKDDTPGCTAQACLFRDYVIKIKQAGADVVGVSLDDIKSHEEFAKKYQLPFPLLADAEGKAATAYGVLGGAPGVRYARRTTFLVDPNGVIAKRYDGVDPKKNAPEVLAELESRKAQAK